MPEPDTAALVEQVRSFITTGQIKRDPALAALTTLVERLEAAERDRTHRGTIAQEFLDRAETAEAEANKLKDKLAFIRTAHKLTEDAEIARLRGALEQIKNELGVPDENYPAPIANAVEIARAALAHTEEEEA